MCHGSAERIWWVFIYCKTRVWFHGYASRKWHSTQNQIHTHTQTFTLCRAEEDVMLFPIERHAALHSSHALDPSVTPAVPMCFHNSTCKPNVEHPVKISLWLQCYKILYTFAWELCPNTLRSVRWGDIFGYCWCSCCYCCWDWFDRMLLNCVGMNNLVNEGETPDCRLWNLFHDVDIIWIRWTIQNIGLDWRKLISSKWKNNNIASRKRYSIPKRGILYFSIVLPIWVWFLRIVQGDMTIDIGNSRPGKYGNNWVTALWSTIWLNDFVRWMWWWHWLWLLLMVAQIKI